MTAEEISMIIEMAEDSMKHAIDHLQKELSKLKTGKASSNMLDGLMVMYYGTPTPLKQVANVATADARTIVIQPWEKSMLAHIEKAIFEENMGITPQNDGEVVRLFIPPLTEDRRKELVKKAKHLAEESKVGVRNARRDAMEEIRKGVKNGLAEDIGKQKEEEIQKLTNKFTEMLDKVAEVKEKEILTV